MKPWRVAIIGSGLCGIVIGVVLSYSIGSLGSGGTGQQFRSAVESCRSGNVDVDVYPVTKIFDGDTLEVWRGGTFEVVRLLNIDTPERHEPGYRKATTALRELVGRGPVRLVWEDEGEPTRGKYGRLLAYVFLGKVGDTCVNVEMIRRGWSPYWTKYGQARFPKRFKQAEREARQNKLGIWANDSDNQSSKQNARDDDGSAGSKVVPWDRAKQHIGEFGTVEGLVVGAHHATRVRGSPTFINIGKPYPEKGRFTVIIWGRHRDKFRVPPERQYHGKLVRVTGDIISYKGEAQIEVESPEQIEIVE